MGLFGKKDVLELIDESFKKEMRRVGLEKYTAKLFPIAKQAIYLDLVKINEENIPIGASKIGGHPDIFLGFHWPSNGDVLLAFLAQINLKEISNLHDGSLLPRTGHLYFFYDCVNMPEGNIHSDKNGFRVLYYDTSEQPLIRIDYPEKLKHQRNSIFPTCQVSFRNKWSLPSYEERKFNNDNYLNYIALENGKETYLLGYCKNIQGDVRETCAIVNLNINHYEEEKIVRTDLKRINKDKEEWILLFQLDSVEECKMMWCDMGMLYFMIKEEDLRNKRFDKTWLVLQCY
ncbi:MAG: DUF1963 domain-containing protein [Bacilli bacterium]|nr:DUF1963 domain-containing protein [Bacilli bacterium]